MIDSLSYIGFTSPDSTAWNRFGPDVLGLQLAEPGADGAIRLRMDDASYRIAIHPGEADDLAYLGWGVAGPRELADAADTLSAAGVKVEHAEAGLAGERAVGDLLWFTDPFGQRHEISWGQLSRPATFHPGRPMSGFVTGRGGLGHAVLITPDLQASDEFYVGVLGFTLSDVINAHGMRLRFYHCNERHHTLALVEQPGIVGFHHLMLEVAALDDLGTALDAVQGGAAELTMTLGRHTNDHMTSFYLRTPVGFEIEYGYGGIVLDEDSPAPRSYDSFSIWGHSFPGGAPTPPGIARPFDPAQTGTVR
ncbi:MAG: VOC family protein [Pseudonocardia sp.]